MPMSPSNIPSILLILLIVLTFVETMFPEKHDFVNKKRSSDEEHEQRNKRLKEIQNELESILNPGQLKDAERPTQDGHQPHPKSEPNLPESSSNLAASSSGVGGSDRQHNLLAARDVHQITSQMHIVKHEGVSEQEKQWHANERAKKIIADLGEEEMQKIRQKFSGYLLKGQKAKTESQPNLPKLSSSGVGRSDRHHNLLAARDVHVHQITGQMQQMNMNKRPSDGDGDEDHAKRHKRPKPIQPGNKSGHLENAKIPSQRGHQPPQPESRPNILESSTPFTASSSGNSIVQELANPHPIIGHNLLAENIGQMPKNQGKQGLQATAIKHIEDSLMADDEEEAPSCQENAAAEGGQLSPEFEEFAADLEGQLESDGDDDKTSNRGSHIKQEEWVEEKVANACDKLRKVFEIRNKSSHKSILLIPMPRPQILSNAREYILQTECQIVKRMEEIRDIWNDPNFVFTPVLINLSQSIGHRQQQQREQQCSSTKNPHAALAERKPPPSPLQIETKGKRPQAVGEEMDGNAGQEKLRRERITEVARELEGVLPINVEEIFPNVKWPKDGPHLCTIVNRATEYAKWLKRELKKLTKIAENGLFYVEQLLP